MPGALDEPEGMLLMTRPASRPILPLALGVIGPLMRAGSGFLQPPASAIVGAVGALVGIAGAVWAHVGAGTFRRTFVEADWQTAGDEMLIRVEAALHRRGAHPIVRVNRRTEDGCEEVVADVRTLSSGTVVVAASCPFAGEVLIQ